MRLRIQNAYNRKFHKVYYNTFSQVGEMIYIIFYLHCMPIGAITGLIKIALKNFLKTKQND